MKNTSLKELKCECGRSVKVDASTVKVTCWSCVSLQQSRLNSKQKD